MNLYLSVLMNYITTEQKNVLGFSANRKRKSKHYIDYIILTLTYANWQGF